MPSVTRRITSAITASLQNSIASTQFTGPIINDETQNHPKAANRGSIDEHLSPQSHARDFCLCGLLVLANSNVRADLGIVPVGSFSTTPHIE